MTDREILDEVHATCKREPDVGSGEIVNIIEQGWQKRDEEEMVQQYNRNREVKDHITDVSEMERHRGLEIGPDGTVMEVK
jgi:hypothetical protein